jgi:hypothetical protein
MLKWLKRASEQAQRRNVERTLTRLVAAAEEADQKIRDSGGQLGSGDARQVNKIQRQLLTDLVGPVPVERLRVDYLDPLLSDPHVSEGARMAVRHVFDSAAREAR